MAVLGKKTGQELESSTNVVQESVSTNTQKFKNWVNVDSKQSKTRSRGPFQYRQERVGFTLTKQEKQTLINKAQSCGLTISAYIIARIIYDKDLP